MTIDLGVNCVLESEGTLRIWNLNSDPNRCMKQVSFSYDLDGQADFMLVDQAAIRMIDGTPTDVLSQCPEWWTDEKDHYNTPDWVDFGSSATARYVRITAVGGPGTGNWGADSPMITGLAEVQVFGVPVPEPAALSLVLSGTAAALLLSGRRRRRVNK